MNTIAHTKNFDNFKYAFLQTIPVLLGYLFMGMAFGLMLHDAGYSFWWAFFISVTVYSGSMQFVLVSLLSGGASLIYTAIMTLFVNGRHIFYGLSFLDRFRKMGAAYPYMIFSLTDETYSLQCGLKVPEGLNENRIRLLISLLDQCYWIVGCVAGAIIGSLLTFDTTGVDFAMTALFVVIVVDQWRESKNHGPAIIGGIVGIFCLVLLGADNFLLPALGLTSLFLIGVRSKWEMQ